MLLNGPEEKTLKAEVPEDQAELTEENEGSNFGNGYGNR